MQSSQREMRRRVVKASHRLPSVLGMAAQTIRAQLPFVLILMTGEALAAQAKQRMSGILNFDLGTRRRRHFLGIVAGLAAQGLVLAFERETGIDGVIERLPIETDERELLSVMFHVAPCAVLLIGRILEYS